MNQSNGLETTCWAATVAPQQFLREVPDTHQAGVLIIGAGVTGSSTAVHLAEAGIDVAVLNEHEPGWGASGRNNGQVRGRTKA